MHHTDREPCNGCQMHRLGVSVQCLMISIVYVLIVTVYTGTLQLSDNNYVITIT